MEPWDLVTKVGGPAIAATLATVYRFVFHRYVRAALVQRRLRDENIGQIPMLASSLVTVAKVVEEIKAELRTNGGKSLRDEVRALAATSAANEQRIRAILQSNQSDAIFEANEAGYWIWANRALLNMTGRSSEEVLGNGWKNFVNVHDRAAVGQEWLHAVRDQRECQIRFTMMTRGKEKEQCLVQLLAFPAHGPNGVGVIGYFGIIENVADTNGLK